MLIPRTPPIQEQSSLDPILHIPVFPPSSNLKFHTTNILNHQQQVLLDNLWATKANTHFLRVMKILSQYFQNQNTTVDQIIPYNSTYHQPLSKIFSPPVVEHFIAQDRTIKLMKTKIKVKKKK